MPWTFSALRTSPTESRAPEVDAVSAPDGTPWPGVPPLPVGDPARSANAPSAGARSAGDAARAGDGRAVTGRPAAAARPSAIAADIRSTMERAISAVRIASALYCIAVYARHSRAVPHPHLGWAVMGALIAWSAFAVWVQLVRRARLARDSAVQAAVAARRPVGFAGHFALRGARFAVADVLVVLILTLATFLVQTADQRAGELATLTTVWAVCPALTAGARRGIVAGLSAAAVQSVASVVVRGGSDGYTLTNIVLLLLAGTATGYLAQLASRAEREAVAAASAAAAERAENAERDRLAREIHDGVLQVLSLVHRRGAELGGDAAALGVLAGEQEQILRQLVARPAPAPEDGTVDLAEALAALRRPGVTVSVPGHPILLDAHSAHETLGAIRAALDNVRRHAGVGAQAWVLLEDDGGQLVISIRDDGIGVSAQRLAEAAEADRMGVAQSIVKRIADVGGAATVGPAPGGGTEVQLTVPRSEVTDAGAVVTTESE
jgi:signal transduction histidine kinase